jgi:[ribosomal protein S5]-alanine N-acetyltransferase
MTLETTDLILRTADPAFADSLVQYYRRNQAFLEAFEPKRNEAYFTRANQKALLRQEAADEADQKGFRFYVFLKADPQTVIGSVGMSQIVWGCFLSCFLSYKMDCDHLNKGYMTQAVGAVVRFAFDSLRLHRIEANIMPRNKPSRRVLEKCGFREEGISEKYLKINGVWEDHVHMVRLNDALQ